MMRESQKEREREGKLKGNQKKRKMKKGKKKRMEEEPGCRWEKLQKVGTFSYSGYSCPRAMKWPWGFALIVGWFMTI